MAISMRLGIAFDTASVLYVPILYAGDYLLGLDELLLWYVSLFMPSD